MKRGNVLFLILLAIALFAVLSYAVTQSSRSSGRDAAAENAITDAAQIMQYAANISTIIQRLRLSNNCKASDISFEGAASNPYTHTPPAENKCKVFHTDGGGIRYRGIELSYQEEHPFFTGAIRIEGIGTSAPELTMLVHSITPEICQHLFEKLYSFSRYTGNDTVGSAAAFIGTFSVTGMIGDQAPELAGKPIGCWDDGSQPRHFYYVLEER